MTENAIKEIFITIAFRAIEAGKEMRLEKGKNTNQSDVMGGAFSKSRAEYDSLTLHVYSTDGSLEEVERGDDEQDGSVR